MNTPVNVGILGYGLVSASRTFHVPLVMFEPRLHLSIVSTLLPDEAKQMIPEVPITTDANEVINDPSIDVIVVALPNTLHYKFAKQALEAGKHVIVEKPLCITSAEIRELMELAHSKGLLLTQFHNRRWDAGFLTVKKLITNQTCGETRLLEMNYDRWAPEVTTGWRDSTELGSGTVYDLGVHLFDQTLSLFGRPLTLSAELGSQRPGSQATDYFNITLGYAEHNVVLRSSMLASLPAPRYRLIGTAGNYVKHGVDMQAGQLNDGMLPNNPTYGLDTSEEYGILHDGIHSQPLPTERGAYDTFYRQLAAHLIDNGEPPAPLHDAHDIVALVEATYRSAAEKRTLTGDEIGYYSV